MGEPKRCRCVSVWGLRQHPVGGLEGCLPGQQTIPKSECPECPEIKVTRDGKRRWPHSLTRETA
jgi:hypothetical protein